MLNQSLLRASLVILGIITAGAAHAQTGADFFKGKTVTYIVATARA